MYVDEYVFGEDGKYKKKIEKEGEHYGRIEGKDGFEFKFADPVNDPKAIDKGDITGVEVVEDEAIAEVLDESGVNDKENQDNKFEYIKNESDASSLKGEGKMDYVVTAKIKVDGVKKPIRPDRLYITKTKTGAVAHNNYNFGNFLWGAGASKLGLPLIIARIGAHWNSLRDKHYKQLDSSDDQFSIKLGYEWSSEH
jgi:hypothetical protein